MGAGLAAVPALSACGAYGSDPDTLTIHSQMGGNAPGSPTFRAVVNQFRKENPDITVKNLVNGDDLGQVYETSRLARAEADVVMVNLYDKTISWTDVGATVPVGKYLDAWGLRERIIPKAVTEWTDQKGRLRAFPYIGTNWPIAYNHALLRRAGVDAPPETYDELVAAAKKLRAKGITPFTVGGNDWTGQKLLLQIMQTFLTPDQATHLFREGDFGASRGAQEGLAYFVDLRDAGVFADKAQGLMSDAMTTQFNTGKAAMQSAMSSALASVPDNVVETTSVGGFPLPDGAVQKKPTILRTYTVSGFWVSPNGVKKIDQVERFIRFMYRRDVVDRFVTEGGRDMSVETNALSKDFPLVAKAQQLGDDVSQVVLPDQYIPAAAATPLIQATSSAFTPGTSARAIRRALESAYRSA